ncbi:uncharacterized protein LOC143516272 isoform X2 [Brachyhypopomus gauderio]|uniref:uncharacterized protein LOC143516272 isoform X2 n=1 Tax=Brachyhypopomus gauderio TaxID=698409 RepID=UPI0040433A7A
MLQRKNEVPPEGQDLSLSPLEHSPRGKIPGACRATNVYYTTRLCERLIQPKSDFDLTDPYGYLLSSEYSSLHDPNLRAYLYRKDIYRRLVAGGFITKDKKVICSLRELNRYKDHLLDVKKNWEQKFRVDQKKLVRSILTLQEHGTTLSDVTVCDITNWLSKNGKIFLRSKWGESSSLTKLPDVGCSSNSPYTSELTWSTTSYKSLHEITKEVWREMKLERHWWINQQEKHIKERQHNVLLQRGRRKEKPSKLKKESSGGDGKKTDELLLTSLNDKQDAGPSESGTLLPPVDASRQCMHDSEKLLLEHDDLALIQKPGSQVNLHTMPSSEVPFFLKCPTAQTGSFHCATQQLSDMALGQEADEDESTILGNMMSVQKTQDASQAKMSHKQTMKCLSNIVAKSIMYSLPIDELLQVPAATVKEVKQAIKDQTNDEQKITLMSNELEVPEVDERKAHSLSGLQTDRLLDSPVPLRATGRRICKRPSDVAHQVTRNEAGLKSRWTPSPPSPTLSNTSLTATEIIDEVIYKLSMGHLYDD